MPDSGPAFRAELNFQRGALIPLLQGLRGWAKLPLSQDLLDAINIAIIRHQDQITSIDATLASMDTLYGTGYPDLPKTQLTTDQLATLRQELDALQQALGEFGVPPTSAGVISLSAFKDLPTQPA